MYLLGAPFSPHEGIPVAAWLRPGPPRSRSRDKALSQGVGLGGDPRRHPWECEEVRQTSSGKESIGVLAVSNRGWFLGDEPLGDGVGRPSELSPRGTRSHGRTLLECFGMSAEGRWAGTAASAPWSRGKWHFRGSQRPPAQGPSVLLPGSRAQQDDNRCTLAPLPLASRPGSCRERQLLNEVENVGFRVREMARPGVAFWLSLVSWCCQWSRGLCLRTPPPPAGIRARGSRSFVWAAGSDVASSLPLKLDLPPALTGKVGLNLDGSGGGGFLSRGDTKQTPISPGCSWAWETRAQATGEQHALSQLTLPPGKHGPIDVGCHGPTHLGEGQVRGAEGGGRTLWSTSVGAGQSLAIASSLGPAEGRQQRKIVLP